MEGRSTEDLCHFLSESFPDIDESILDNIRRHKIDGSVFMQLNEEYLREVAPLLGDRIKLKNIISKSLDTPDVFVCEVSEFFNKY